MPGLVSKWFRVAVAGQTVDGREIQEQWIHDSVDTYNPQTYGARVWPEHWRSLTPGGEFKAQGDVIALKKQTDTIDGQKRLCLYAQIAPLPCLVKMNQEREKIYTSIEITEDFAGTGKAYLTGLAVTDSPASLGTEALTFSANHMHKQITDSIETEIEFTDKAQQGQGEPAKPTESKFSQIMNNVRGMFKKTDKDTDTRFTEVAQAMEVMGKAFMDEQATQAKEFGERLSALQERLSKQGKELEDLKQKYSVIDNLDANSTQRPPATGSDGFAMADC